MQPTPLRLCWFYVKWHSFRLAETVGLSTAFSDYEGFRWCILRPERSDRSTCIEEVDDARRKEFVVKFRSEGERVAYWNLVKRRLCALHHCEAPPVRTLETMSRCDFPSVTGDMYDNYR